MTAFSGHLHIEAAALAKGRTTLVRQSFRAPFHIGKGYWDGKVLQVRVVNPTAGILSGDRLELLVRSTDGAALLVMTPSATRAFMMKSGVAECRQQFTVGAGAWLEYAPEPLYPHRESDYSQTTLLDVAAGGELFYADAIAPGRAGRGECWAWRRLRLDLDVICEGELVLRERFDGSGADLGRTASFYSMSEAWFGTVVAISPRLEPASAIWDRIRGLHGGGRWVGATRLRRGGWIVRIVAPSSPALREAMAAVRAMVSETLPLLTSDLRRL